MDGRIRALLAGLLLLVCGCDAEPLEDWIAQTDKSAAGSPTTSVQKPYPFDSSLAGSVAGRLSWVGEAPEAKPFSYYRFVVGKGFVWGNQPNPNKPQIDPTTSGLGGVLVYLRGHGLKQGRAWDHPPVVVELKDFQIRVRQGDTVSGVGFVQPGDEIEMVARAAELYSLQGRGAGFFTVKLPVPELPVRRQVPAAGEVRLTSASNHFWAEAHLISCEHPYYCVTAADGSFTLPEVPAGEYDLICRVPNWNVDLIERDPETGGIARQWYKEPVIISRRVTIKPGEKAELDLSLREEQFTR